MAMSNELEPDVMRARHQHLLDQLEKAETMDAVQDAILADEYA